MTRQLDVKPRHREQLEGLLRAHLPGVEVWAYGSRVNGRSHEGSDLDLVLRSPGLVKIDPSQLAEFNEAVQESTVPFLIEARDWARLPESFQREIEREYVVLVAGEEQGEGEQLFGPLPADWEQTTLGTACSRGGGAIQTGPFGSQLHASDYVPVGIPSIMPQNIGDNWIDENGIARISQEDANRLKRYLVREGDIVYSRRGDVEKRALVRDAEDGWLCGTGCLRVRLGDNGVDPRYASYFLGHPRVREWIVRHAHGATMLNLNTSILSACPFVIPPKKERRAIAHILGTLDDKIELNRRMNETLEEMARALFKSWFIDFDPVHAKATLKRHAAAQITPPLRGSRQAKGDSPQASRWGDHAAPHPPRRWAEIKRQYSPQTLQRAQALRQNQTSAEGLLWHYLSRKQLAGYRFRRQQPIGPYIADFACLPEKLLIELDGGQHAERTASDNRRDRFLQEKGYRVLRFWNHEVFENCFGVLESIYAALPHHPPLEGGSKDGSLSGRGSPPPPQPAPGGLASATPPPGGSDWSVERARAYLDGMDPGIAALFPDRFVDSELGKIPEGWEVGKFGDHISATRGLSYKGTGLCRDNEGLPMHNLNSIFEGGGYKHDGIKYYKGEYREKHLLKPGDLIVTNTEQGFDRLLIGYAAIIPESFGPVGLYSHHIYRIDTKPKSFLTPHYLVHLFNSPFYHHWISGFSNGTTINMLPMDAFEIPLVVVPPSELIRAFTILAQDIHAQFQSNLGQSRTLAAIRDTLLPKLTSGEVRILEAERLETPP